MPIYEYQCDACGHQLEKLQKISDPVLKECPACHQSTLNKLVSAAGFQLKGTGWYATDFKNKGVGEKKDSSPAPAAVTTKSEDKSDSSSSNSTSGTTES